MYVSNIFILLSEYIYIYIYCLLTCLFRDFCFPDSKSSPNFTVHHNSPISLAGIPLSIDSR